MVAGLPQQWNSVLEALSDPAVSEVTANGPDSFFMARGGKRIPMNIVFKNEDEYMESIGTHLAPLVRCTDPWDPHGNLFEGYLSARFRGTKVAGRCTIVLPPACMTAQITITNRVASLTTLEQIASTGSMSTEMFHFMEAAVKSGLTMAFSGSTGAGKSTVMEACTKLFSDDVRIGVAEDTPELHLIQPNVSYLNSVLWKPGKEEKDIASLSWVVQQFQRMRIDKVIVGEVRGKEFADFLVAANSGLGGSMITMHAEDPQNCLTKMTEFAMSGAPGRPVRAINSSIGNTIDLIVQLVKTSDGRRRVSHIQEVTATIGNTEDAKISSSPLYLWDEKTDKFYRPGSMSDAMRKKMMDQGIDVTEFITSPLEARFGAHGSVTGASISSEINPLQPTQRPIPGGSQAVASSGTGVSRSAVRRSIPRSL